MASRVNQVLGHLSFSALNPLTAVPCSSDEPLSKMAIETIKKERENAKFNIREMTYLLFDGKKKAELFEIVGKQLERDHIFADDYFDVPGRVQRELVYARVKRMMEYRNVDDAETWAMRRQVNAVIDPSLDIRIAVHATLFRESIAQNGTEEQCRLWLPDVDSYKIPGCFAMTELGHGSNVQGFETTATFDRERDEFIIHTPTETATKWWIGGAAHSALASVCYARLIIDGKDYGVYNFFVPLRNRADHSLLPGINIGDCGPKMGRGGIDNGWIQYTHVRIPRDYMLMRWAKVDRDGNFTQSPAIQLSYGALVGGRISMVQNASIMAKKAVTIATRYGVCRRQFPADASKGNKEELPIMDYATHQYKLMPILADAFATDFAAKALIAASEKVQAELKQGDITNLNDLHAISAGMKAQSTWATLSSIETCRQSLGGHGFSTYAGLASWGNDYGVHVSWEGDNTVMMLQTARYLIKSLSQVKKGKSLIGEAAYLSRFREILSSKMNAQSPDGLRDSAAQIAAFEYLATKLTVDAAAKMAELVKSGMTPEQAWNATSVDLMQAASAHCYLFMVRTFVKRVDAVGDVSLRAVLKQLQDLFALYHLKQWMATLLEGSYVTPQQSKMINSFVVEACHEVRSQAIPLTDAFNFSDFMLKSPLAKKNGDIYTAYFDRVKRAPEAQGRPYYWEQLIKPVMFKHHNKKDPFSG